MLTVAQSNRPEVLADRLAELIRCEPLPPLADETIVVQTDALGRWLKLALADRLGIAASIRFPLPVGFVWELITRVLPDVPRDSPLAPGVLKWRVAAALGGATNDAPFVEVRRYLADGDPLKAYQLAGRLAGVIDRYLVYRPDWIAAWSAERELALGPEEAWQAALWRAVAADLPPAARTDPRERFLSAIEDDGRARAALPQRIHLFALEALPPAYLEFFRRIARHREVRMWILNPCAEYWPLIDDPRRVARARVEAGPDAAHRETGNRLLASLGAQGRALIDAVVEEPGGMEGEFVSPDADKSTLLAALQGDILALRERGDDGAPLLEPDPADCSLAVQVCHSPMREIEVLHDQLLDRFARDPTLRPADVLVLMPDVALYAPFVDAVFGTAPRERHIPYAIADRPRSAAVTQRAFRAVLALPDERLEAEAVLALLEFPAIARRFGISAGDLPEVRAWVRRAGIRWGRDESTRVRLGLPPARAHSWRAGLERLLLGYAMAGDGSQLFAGVLPVDGVEGGDAALAARLAWFAESVFDVDDALRDERPLRDWRTTLTRALERLLAPDEEEASELVELRAGIEQMARDAEAAGYAEAVPLAVVRAHLESALGAGGRTEAFLAGGVTFAALGPSRPLPARIVCLVGMNDGSFPRDERPASFDLLAHHPRRGDPSRRHEDRYAFLQALLAARDALYVSYVGRSVRDNQPLPPSPLVTELRDVAQASYPAARRDAVRGTLVIEHPLQAFSRRYRADDARLFTFASEYARRQPPPPPPRFAGRRLPDTDPIPILTIAALARFLKNPVRHFFERRLGLRLDAGDGPLEGAEPFDLAGLERWDADQRAFELRRVGRDVNEVRDVLRAAGMLPDGTAGDAALRERVAAIDPIVSEVATATASFLPPIEKVLELPGTTPAVRLAVTLDCLTPDGRLAWRVGRLRASDRLAAWLAHLVLAVLAPLGVAVRTRIFSHSAPVRFGRPERPLEALATLAALYVAGANEPLPFFPDTALAFVQGLAKGTSTAWDAAAAEWEDERNYDAYYKLAFADADPLDERFAEYARMVCLPMLAAELRDE